MAPCLLGEYIEIMRIFHLIDYIEKKCDYNDQILTDMPDLEVVPLQWPALDIPELLISRFSIFCRIAQRSLLSCFLHGFVF